jgi:hypothetical protein
LKQLEDENAKLKRIVADLSPDKDRRHSAKALRPSGSASWSKRSVVTDVSIRRACGVFEMVTSIYHYKSRRPGQAISTSGSERYAKRACAMTIGGFTCCSGARRLRR